MIASVNLHVLKSLVSLTCKCYQVLSGGTEVYFAQEYIRLLLLTESSLYLAVHFLNRTVLEACFQFLKIASCFVKVQFEESDPVLWPVYSFLWDNM